MADVFFYHLEKVNLDRVLPQLLQKCLENKWRCEVRTDNADHADHLDQWLWTYHTGSFLPHGRVNDANADRMPVLITHEPEDHKDIPADVLFLVGGADHALIGDYVRFIYIFSGHDEEAKQRARLAWKRAKEHEHEVSYWRQNERGQWEKKG